MTADESKAVNFELDRDAVAVRGTVVDAAGGPLPEAKITVSQAISAIARTKTSTVADADGRFEVWTAPGHHELYAHAEGYASTRLIVTSPVDSLQVKLVPGGMLHGHVVDASTREPVSDVEVRAAPENFNPALSDAVRSGEEGEFSIRDLEPGRYLVQAESDTARGSSSRAIELGLGQTINDIVVEVVSAVRVEGRVTIEPGEQPCDRGLVSLGPYHPALRAFTDAALPEPTADAKAVPSLMATLQPDGTVTFKGATPGSYYVAIQCLEHVRVAGPSVVQVSDRPLSGLRWTVRPGLSLDVLVVDARGVPLPSTGVLLEWPAVPDRATGMMPLTTDLTGHAQVPANLFPGDYTLHPGTGFTGKPVKVALRKGDQRSSVTLKLDGSAAISVDVTREGGGSVEGAQVSALRTDGVGAEPPAALVGLSLGGGRYRVGPLAAGSYTVTVRAGGSPPVTAKLGSEESIVIGSQDVVALAVLPRASTLRGRVVDESGEPLANVVVTIDPENESPELRALTMFDAPAARTLSDADGNFELDDLSVTARYRVRAELAPDRVAVRSASTDEPVQLVLSAASAHARP